MGFREIEDEATRDIFKILDQIDVTANLDPPDIRYLEELKERQPKANSQHPSHGVREQQDEFSPTQEDTSTSQRQQSLSSLCLKETGYRLPSMMYPRRGDISKAFNLDGDERQNEKDGALSSLGAFNVSISKPRLPYTRLQNKNKIDGDRVPAYDPKLEAAKEIHMQLRHTGVTLENLIELEEASKHWTGLCDNSTNNNDMSSDSNPISTTDAATAQTRFPEQRNSSMNREEKEKLEKKWKEDQVEEEKERQKALLEKSLLHEKTAEQQTKIEKPEKLENAVGEAEDEPLGLVLGLAVEETVDSGENGDELPLKDNPEYKKYFKMIKMGMAREQVLHSMKRDEKDPRILDFDPNKSLKSQKVVEATENDNEPPLKNDPEYAKYFKMLKIGMPEDQVFHAMTRDEKDSKILDLDPNKSLKSQQLETTGDVDGPPLKDDPEFSKYFKMIKMGIPREQALHAMKRDEKDPKILDLDPNKSLKSQQLETTDDDGPVLKDDPDYAKYFKMVKMGLPKGSVKNALVRDGKDPVIIDLDPNKNLKSQLGGKEIEEKDTGIPLKDDPEYAKYFKMKKMGLPKDAVRNALARDGKDSSVIDLDPDKSVFFQMKKKNSSLKNVTIKKKKKVRRKKIYWNP